ncbi:unnamed protein product [Bursaphelenchus xylophilus]|uniref:(pine wood nematode) hypothetical protein n=1 Tax=Bursaphelenchus xylophilus TaxID=6326 RepID=A0A1I7RYI6_BURXY|nr:unnamed protein product [Bursaphelenchus xylophilus]CAG9092644.1 unnamed protein product [Bursaphelenchus xylophilus]
MKVFFSSFLVLLLAQSVSADESEVRDIIHGLLNKAGVNISKADAHELVLSYRHEAIRLSNKYQLYNIVEPQLEKIDGKFDALKGERNPNGPKLSAIVGSLKALRSQLAAKASELELAFLDVEIDVLSALQNAPTQAIQFAKFKQISVNGNLGLSDARIHELLVNTPLEAYNQAAKVKLNPVRLVKAYNEALLNLDQKHPLSSSLRVLIDSLVELDNAIHPQNKALAPVGKNVIKDQIKLLRDAKSRQDDYLLDHLSGKALSLYESLVDNLLDLKAEIRISIS